MRGHYQSLIQDIPLKKIWSIQSPAIKDDICEITTRQNDCTSSHIDRRVKDHHPAFAVDSRDILICEKYNIKLAAQVEVQNGQAQAADSRRSWSMSMLTMDPNTES
jgi:hypothetical protein